MSSPPPSVASPRDIPLPLEKACLLLAAFNAAMVAAMSPSL
jgi:hypothetical protein